MAWAMVARFNKSALARSVQHTANHRTTVAQRRVASVRVFIDINARKATTVYPLVNASNYVSL